MLGVDAAENGVKQADSILFQDDFPVLLHNSSVVSRENIFRYLKKSTRGLHAPPKDSADALRAKRLSNLLQGPLHTITVSPQTL